MYALAAFLPLVVVILLMAWWRWSSSRALLAGWLVAAFITMTLWQIPLARVLAYSAYGALQSLDILIIVFGALLLLNTLKGSGAMGVIQRGFARTSGDARIQALILGFGFVSFIEGAAGFGTPAALAAPLLVGLGWRPLAAVFITLLFDSASVVFGAAGTPMFATFAATADHVARAGADPELFARSLTFWAALPNAMVALLLPLAGVALLIRFFGDGTDWVRPTLEVLPFSLLTGIAFAVPYLLLARFAGPELPSLLAALICLGVQGLAVRCGFLLPRRTWRLPTDTATTGDLPAPAATPAGERLSLLRAWLPYLSVATLLTVTRVPAFGLQDLLARQELVLEGLFGLPELSYRLRWAYLPGVIPFALVAVLTFALHRMQRREIVASLLASGQQLGKAVIALVAGVALVQLLLKSANNPVLLAEGVPLGGMVQAMASAAVNTGPAYPFLAPFVGALGSFISGSATVSNLLFASFQYETAAALGVDPRFILAGQCSGAALGNMVCIVNIVAVCTTVGLVGQESEVLRKTALPALVYGVAVSMLVTLAVTLT